MNKSGYILVKDIPDCCARCDYIGYDDDSCVCDIEYKCIPNDLVLPVWCPIKPLPKPLKIEDHNGAYDAGLCLGHNSCLDIIINGGNDNEIS